MRLFSILCSLMLIISCATEDNLISYELENPFETGELAPVDLEGKLKSSPNGWEFCINKSRITPTAISYGYISFESQQKFGFALNNSVEYRTFDENNSYRISNTFTLSKLHLLTLDNGQESKMGQFINDFDLIDSVYTYLNTRNDTLFFVGDQKGRLLSLFPTNSTSKQKYTTQVWKENFDKYEEFFNKPKFFFNVLFDNLSFFFYKDEAKERNVFHYMDGNDEKYVINQINHLFECKMFAERIELDNPIQIGSNKIKLFRDIDITTSAILFEDGYIKNESTPIYTNNLGIQTLQSRNPLSFSVNDGPWTSYYGWSKRNQLDIFDMKVYNQNFLQIYQYNVGGTGEPPRSRCGYLTINSNNEWVAHGGDKPAFYTGINNNFIKFTTDWWSWTWPTPTSTVSQLQNNNINTMTRSAGFIALRTIGNKPILVFADDAETWVIYDNR